MAELRDDPQKPLKAVAGVVAAALTYFFGPDIVDLPRWGDLLLAGAFLGASVYFTPNPKTTRPKKKRRVR